MKKQSINFTGPQMAWLKKEAKRLGISIADAVRRTIDHFRDLQEGVNR